MAERGVNQRNDITRSFQRVFSFPLDVSTIFDSYEDAEKYALGDGSDSRKLGKTAYLGQIISVVDPISGTVTTYQIAFGENGDAAPYTLQTIAAGGGGGSTSIPITIDGTTIPAGSNLQEVILKLKEVIESKGEGETSDAIVVGGETIVQPDTDYTDALNALADYLNNVHDDITLNGDTLIAEGTSITEALQTIVDEMEDMGGVNSAKVNNVDVYDPGTRDIAFNLEGADSDINIEFDEDAAVPTFYVEVNGISNGSISLPGRQVDWDLYIYQEGTTNLLKGPDSYTSFVVGTEDVDNIEISPITGYSTTFQDNSGHTYSPDPVTGKYTLPISEGDTEFILFAIPE